MVTFATVQFLLDISQNNGIVSTMKIKFLRYCIAPQESMRTFCECCGPERQGKQPQPFFKDDEANPEENGSEIDLTGLKYREDYDIIEFS